MTRQTFSVTASNEPPEAWTQPDEGGPFVTVHADPVETTVQGAVRIAMGFPVLTVTGIVQDPCGFAHRVADALNGPAHGWTVEPDTSVRDGDLLVLTHRDGREILVNPSREERQARFTFPRPITDALRDVVEERDRQQRPTMHGGEGRTTEDDDYRNSGDLARAAGCYALTAGRITGEDFGGVDNVPTALAPFWPWAANWWKPDGGSRRMLVKAAALILAEIERLDRRAKASAHVGGKGPDRASDATDAPDHWTRADHTQALDAIANGERDA